MSSSHAARCGGPARDPNKLSLKGEIPMKKFWKALGITALAATLIPYRVHKDHDTDTTTMDALLWQAIRRPGEGEDKGQLDITFGFKSPFQELQEERELFTDDPNEAVPFTGSETAADLAESAAEKAADLAEKVEDAVEDAADAVEEAVEKLEQSAEPVVTEADFDPEV